MNCQLCHKRPDPHNSVIGPICTWCRAAIKRNRVGRIPSHPGIEQLEASLAELREAEDWYHELDEDGTARPDEWVAALNYVLRATHLAHEAAKTFPECRTTT